MSSILKAGLPQQPRPPTLTPIRYSAAAAGATQHANNTAPHPTTTTTTTTTTSTTNPAPIVTSLPLQPPAPSITTTVTTPPTQDQLSRISSSPSLTHPSVTSPMLSSASAANLDESLYSVDDSPSPMVSEDQANVATSSPHVAPRIGESPRSVFTTAFHRLFTAGPTGTPPDVPHSPKPTVSLPFHAAWLQRWCRGLTIVVFLACSDC